MPRRTTEFQTIRSEGGLLPSDLLRRVVDAASKVPGVTPAAYGLPAGERLNDAITQSWNRLRRCWTEFRAAAKGQSEGEATTGLTNDKWSLPLLRELGFGFLATTSGPTIEGKTYAISRFAGATAIHLVGCGVSLDRRAAGVRGAAAGNPHGLVQEFLNRSSAHLWAIVSNGLSFRILRDNQALSRQSFLEFDLETMFEGEVYSDFVLLWLVAHATRFLPCNEGRPDSCYLETWSKEAAEQGVAALTDLRGGVEKALQILGQGFVSHPRNTALRESLRKGEVKLSNFHGQLLRVVYRLIFLFVAEDRELEGIPLLHPQDKSEKARSARDLYSTNYSTSRLRELASRIKGSRHGDLWRQFQLLVGALSGDERFVAMRDALALPSLGSMLWNPGSTNLLNGPGLGEPGAELANVDFLDALRHLAFIRKDKVLRPVDYKNLGSEEFGGVYESFLALTPQISSDGARFTFAEFAGNERKTSGSYYTPDSLVQCLLDSALDPVVQERLAGKTGKEAEKALLAIKVCDKAVGSGHFLVGAAHRLARHLARVRALAAGESEPSPLLYQTALRDVIGHCLYGVDINPMSVELCKVTLWLEALEPGKPLSFLDHHIRCGNSLLGAIPELIKGGIPDEAYEAIEGDDKEACAALKKKNKRENPKLGDWFIADEAVLRDKLYQASVAIDEIGDSRPEDIRRKEAAFRSAQSNYDFGKAWDLANLWCAAFVIKKHFPASAASNSATANSPSAVPAAPAETQAVMFGGAEEAPKAKTKKTKTPGRADSETVIGITTQHLRDFVEGGALPDGLLAESKQLADQYQFFHFHLAFPEVVAQGGFDVSLGNPPWERLKIQEKEWFAQCRPDIANAVNAAGRRKLLVKLQQEDPSLFAEWLNESRKVEAENHFVRDSGRFPLSGRGDINTYSVFAELGQSLITASGRFASILPLGIVTDDTTKALFCALLNTNRLVAVTGFVNERMLFPSVLHNFKFCIFACCGSGASGLTPPSFAFDCLDISEANDINRRFSLSAAQVAIVNPLTLTCPAFLQRRSVDLVLAIYGRNPIFAAQQSGWNTDFFSMLHMGNASDLFVTTPSKQSVPVFEAKMFNQFNHRFSSYHELTSGSRSHMLPRLSVEQLQDPQFVTAPCYFCDRGEVQKRLLDKCSTHWLIASRRISNPGLARTSTWAVLPLVGASDSITLATALSLSGRKAACLVAMMNSFPLDFCLRQKHRDATLSFYVIRQLPVVGLSELQNSANWGRTESIENWIATRAIELLFTSWDLEAFAQDCGWSGPPFRWDEERRFLLRCELDAAFFHLYLGSEEEWRKQPAALTQAFPTPRAAVSYIMDTFPIVKRKDEARSEQKNAAGEVVKPGRYITNDTILDIYDALAESIRSGQPYQTRLTPPPADPRCCHPKKKIGILAFGSLITDPGSELEKKIIMRIKTQTPFGVEYARYSGTRGGAPTLVPHPTGSPVSGEILVLDDAVTSAEARDMLWRRERRKEGTGETYLEGTTANSVLVREWADSPCVVRVLYTDFHLEGKDAKPEAAELAKKAIQSVKAAQPGMDGITYLKNNMASGVKTKLSADYEAEILKQTKTNSFEAALEKAKTS